MNHEVSSSIEDEWLWGWDETPGIVSVWVNADGQATVWRRIGEALELVREEERFRPWILLDRLDDLRHLGPKLGPEGDAFALVAYRELKGPGDLRYLVSAKQASTLTSAVLRGAARRLQRPVGQLRELGKEHVLSLPPEEQYLVSTGRTYFRDLAFHQLRRLQFDLETTGLDPVRDRIFLVAVSDPDGKVEILESAGKGDAAEASLIERLVAKVQASDPDVIENHNLHGFDLPFLDERARRLRVPLALGRIGPPRLGHRPARRGVSTGADSRTRVRLVAPGRELIDTMDAVLRHDFATRDLKGHGLKAVARYLGITGPERELIPGDRVHEVYQRDPERVRRYATADVEEAAGVAKVFGGAAFALARMAPRRYERLADAGAATGIIDPLIVRAYLRAGMALPAHRVGRDVAHQGAALHLFASGVATRIVKADVASLYPSLMRAYRIGPERDHLGVMVALVDRLVERRLHEKALARKAPAGSSDRFTHEATSSAMKLVVNSAYGYLAAGGGLTRFADVDAANEVTRRGRETLSQMCRELLARGVTLIEADTDGVYFAVPEAWVERDERRVVAEVASLLPPLVQLEFEGRYQAMLSHEPKNYALLSYEGHLILRGVAFRSSRAEPFGEEFLRRAISCLLVGDIGGVREAYLSTARSLLRRELTTHSVSSRVRLAKTKEQYLATRENRREAPYEALLCADHETWSIGDRVRVYRAAGGVPRLAAAFAEASSGETDTGPRDYDVDHYLRLLRLTYASRLVRALARDDFEAVFADPSQLTLFSPPLAAMRPILTPEPHE